MVTTMTYHIDAPVEKVFDFFQDPNSQVESSPFGDMVVHDVTVTQEGVGTHYSWSVKIAGVPLRGFDVYTEYVPNERFVEKSSSTMVGTWEYTFAAEGRGTRVTLQHRQRGIWNVPPLRNLTDFLTPRLSRSFLDAVKARLEAGATVPAQRKPAAAKRRKAVARR